MSFTRSTVAKGAGAVAIRRISDSRLLYLNNNSKYTFTKNTTDGEKVQGFNSTGALVDLDVAGQETTFELEVASKKNTRNINEMVLDSEYVTKATYSTPWVETATVASGSVTLNGSASPTATTMAVTLLDGTKLTSTGGTPAAGQFKDNGDGTVTFNAAENGKTVVIFYKYTASNVFVQGGADQSNIGYVEVMFHQVSGSSSDPTKKGVDVLWLPKCSLSGESTFEFSNEVQDKSFKLTAIIPDSPAGYLVPYVWIRDIEIVNTNAG